MKKEIENEYMTSLTVTNHHYVIEELINRKIKGKKFGGDLELIMIDFENWDCEEFTDKNEKKWYLLEKIYEDYK